jgi:hypothetical protein
MTATDGDDRKAAIFEAACRWAEGDGYAILGDRFEFSELNVYRFVGDPRDILVDAYLALTGLTPTQPDRDQIALMYWITQGYDRRDFHTADGNSDRRMAYSFADEFLRSALFNGGTNG